MYEPRMQQRGCVQLKPRGATGCHVRREQCAREVQSRSARPLEVNEVAVQRLRSTDRQGGESFYSRRAARRGFGTGSSQSATRTIS